MTGAARRMRRPSRKHPHGTWREEHLFALHQAVAAYEFCHQQIAECDAKIEAQLQTFEDRSQGERLPPKPEAALQSAGRSRLGHCSIA